MAEKGGSGFLMAVLWLVGAGAALNGMGEGECRREDGETVPGYLKLVVAADWPFLAMINAIGHLVSGETIVTICSRSALSDTGDTTR